MATLYVSQHVSFTLEQQAEFNKLSARIPRQYKYVGNLIAGATLTTPALGGSYITVSDAVLRRKQRLISRLLAEPGDTRTAMQGILLRSCRAHGNLDTTMLGCRSSIISQASAAFPGMILDLAVACGSNGIQMEMEGVKRAPPHLQIPPPAGISKKLNRWLDAYGIASLDELLEWSPDGPHPGQWLQTVQAVKPVAKELLERLHARSVTLGNQPNAYRLLRGQTLAVTPTVQAVTAYHFPHLDIAIIMLGYLPDTQEWMFTPWYKVTPGGRKYRICPDYEALGAGGNYRATETDILLWHPKRLFHTDQVSKPEFTVTASNPTLQLHGDPL